MSSGNTLFSVGIYGRMSRYTYNQNSEDQFSAMADHFALGFKLRKRMGMSFGLKPFSSRGYSFTQKIYTGTDSIKYVYLGQGGIQDLFLGFSYGIIQKKSTKISLGINASYLFGKVMNEKQAILIDPNTISGGIGRNSITVNSFHYEVGAFFRHKMGKRHEFSVSAVIAPRQSISATSIDELYIASNINNLATYDVLDYMNSKGKINVGMEQKYGLAYEFLLPDLNRKTRSLHPQLTFLFSYSTLNESTPNFEYLTTWKSELASKIGIGLQFKPEAKLYENISTLKTLEKVSYRFGAYFSTLPYTSATGKNYIEQAITAGFGVPILAQQGLSSLNLSVGLGKRGIDEPGYTNEEFITFNFGVVISPSSFDRWFRKRKLD
jgi:hypothetical protein